MTQELVAVVQEKWASLIAEVISDKGDLTLRVLPKNLKKLLSVLKTEPALDFDMLIDVFAVDYLHWEEKEARFEITYNLYSYQKKHRILVKVSVMEGDPSVETATDLWPAANWYEREVWDMMGIVFKGHPNLKRILMYEEFQGHPLRKDYPYNRRQPIIGPVN